MVSCTEPAAACPWLDLPEEVWDLVCQRLPPGARASLALAHPDLLPCLTRGGMALVGGSACAGDAARRSALRALTDPGVAAHLTSLEARPRAAPGPVCARHSARGTAVPPAAAEQGAEGLRAAQFGPALAALAGPRVLCALGRLRALTITNAHTLQLPRLAAVEAQLTALDLTGCRLTLPSTRGWPFLSSGGRPESRRAGARDARRRARA